MTIQEDQFSKSIMLSLMLHLSVLILYSLKLVFYPEESLIYEQSIRVDLVALPDKIANLEAPPIEEAVAEPVKEAPKEPVKPQPEPKNPEPPPLVKPAEPKPLDPTVILEKLRAKKKVETESVIDKLRKDVAIEKVKGMVKDQKSPDVKSPTAKYKGNILSPGTELTGINKMDHQDYHTLLDRHVKQYWSLPEWVSKNNFKTQIRIYLDENGVLLDAKIVKASGRPSYDESALESVRRASPFPAPPAKFRNIVQVDGILLGFPE